MISSHPKTEGFFRMPGALNENWKPLVGFDGLYSVSDLGRIRSEPRAVARKGRGTLFIPGKILRTPPTQGYPRFNASRDGVATQIFVHQAVMLAFIGPPAAGEEVRHKNGNRSDARLKNLEYGTRSQNIADAKRHGTFLVHENRPGAILTRDQAVIIATSGATAETIGERVGIKRGTVTQVRSGRTWKEFTEGRLKPDYYRRGESASWSKLSEKDVLEIAASRSSQRTLAMIYNVSPRAIWAIRNGLSWNSITGRKKPGANPTARRPDAMIGGTPE